MRLQLGLLVLAPRLLRSAQVPARPHQPPPERRDCERCALRDDCDSVAVARRLAREGDDSAGAQHAPELAERLLQVRDVVQHGVAEDDVERVVLERQPLGVAHDRLDRGRQAEALGGGGQRLQHPGRDVCCHHLVEPAVAQQVQREVAGAGADLEAASVRVRAVAAQRLVHLAEHLDGALAAEVDAPFGVVGVRREVVIADVRVQDLLRGLLRHDDGGGL